MIDIPNQIDSTKPLSSNDWLLLGRNGWLSCETALNTVKTYESLGKAGLSRSHLFSMGAHLFGCTMAIQNLGTKKQKDKWLPELTSGQSVGALAFTGPDKGSRTDDVGASYQDDGDIILRGEKTCVTNGAAADVFVVSANRAENPSGMNLTLFIVPAKTKGLTISPLTTNQGLKASPMARVKFEDCVIPKNNRLGSPGVGALLSVMTWERSCILAGFLGALDRDLEAVTTLFKTRKDQTGPLFRHQSISHKLALIRTDIEASRQLIYHAANCLDQNEDPVLYSALCKQFVSQTLIRASQILCELMAGRAWLGEMGLAEAMSDMMGVLSASGTSHVQLNAIAARM